MNGSGQAGASDPLLFEEAMNVFEDWISRQPYGDEAAAGTVLIHRVLALADQYNRRAIQKHQ